MKYAFIPFLIILVAVANSQELVREQPIKLRFNKNKIHLSIPYKKIRVLDNRFEKSSVFIDQIGEYPVTVLLANAAAAIETYFDDAVNQFSNGKDTLLINVEELNAPNRRLSIASKGKTPAAKSLDSRNYIRVSATCYYKTPNNLYRKVVTICKKYDIYYPAVPIQRTIEEILNDIIQAASIGLNAESISLKTRKRLKHLIKDSTAFIYQANSVFQTLEEINFPVAIKWKNLPIFSTQNDLRHANYRKFVDFRKDSIIQDSFDIVSSGKDSLFKISIPKTDSLRNSHLPYAVIADGKFYIQLIDSFYLPMDRQASTFYFYIPKSLPDMYALLSIEDLMARHSSALPSSGSIIWDALGLTAGTLIEGIAKTSEERKIIREGLNHSFRHCVINMDSGDFIYSYTKPRFNLSQAPL